MCQGFRFFLRNFELAKSATSSIRVKSQAPHLFLEATSYCEETNQKLLVFTLAIMSSWLDDLFGSHYTNKDSSLTH